MRRAKVHATRKPSRQSAAVNELLFQIKAARLPQPTTEFRFHPSRRWRFDLAWAHIDRPGRLVEYNDIYAAVEVDGGVHSGGRHVRGTGYERDCEKLNTAALMGWRVLRVTPKHVKSGQALTWIQELLK